ncbi:hypothetical protein [Crocosphaera chwakensis]|uniref:Uncharacterized protein n=1 Tax=Crocosphaera chwakensis CCY0110 TaxID=391612 RepID=A3IPR6_9CHRO|nr:hypothetical protein [Crocosphaera chwakensis]EAZ91556.1 hypothetical protein CY0110_13586 [Crocosphaera chwakensis CCY0110]
MKFSERRFIGDEQPNALDMGYGTVIQRHHRQKWKYEYPRHIRPRVCPLSTQDTLTHYPVESQAIINQPSEDQVCSLSIKSPETLRVNEVSKTHLQNVCRNLERRLKKAQLKGDQWLISLLEKEFQDMGELCMYS